MKTAIDIPDDLFKLIKMRAVHKGSKLKDEVTNLLRLGLVAEETGAPLRPAVLEPDPQTGLLTLRCVRRAPPGEEATADRLAEILLEQEAEWAREAR